MNSKYFIVCLVLILVGLRSGAKEFNYSDIVIDKMVICGSSSISDFILTFIGDKDKRVANVCSENDSIISFHIPVECISASNQLLINNFQEFIKAREYPNINVAIDKKQIQDIIKGGENDLLSFNVTISGNSNVYRIPFTLGKFQGNYKYVTGRVNMRLTDFNLKPSKKIFGLIKVSNEVFINFRINFRPA